MWTLNAEYFSIKNAISKNIDEEIDWNDEIYKGGAEVKLGFNLNIFRVLVDRTISKGLRHELGAGFGAHILDVNTGSSQYQ
jgi:hypothetical protein